MTRVDCSQMNASVPDASFTVSTEYAPAPNARNNFFCTENDNLAHPVLGYNLQPSDDQ